MESLRGTIADINGRIERNEAVVWSAAALAGRRHANIPLGKVDIVTIAFESSLSGTAAMLCVPVAGRGVFTRAESIWLNGVEGKPGPAPNERLGIVDTMILADVEREEQGAAYNGGQLLFEMIRGDRIDVECLAVEGSRHSTRVTLADLEFARFYVYNAFVDSGLPEPVLGAVGRGSRVLLNGAQGIIVGPGTRDSSVRRAWSLAANMQAMGPDLMADKDGSGTHCLKNVIAIAVPILDQALLDAVLDWTASRQLTSREIAASQQAHDRILHGGFTLTDTDYSI